MPSLKSRSDFIEFLDLAEANPDPQALYGQYRSALKANGHEFLLDDTPLIQLVRPQLRKELENNKGAKAFLSHLPSNKAESDRADQRQSLSRLGFEIIFLDELPFLLDCNEAINIRNRMTFLGGLYGVKRQTIKYLLPKGDGRKIEHIAQGKAKKPKGSVIKTIEKHLHTEVIGGTWITSGNPTPKFLLPIGAAILGCLKFLEAVSGNSKYSDIPDLKPGAASEWFALARPLVDGCFTSLTSIVGKILYLKEILDLIDKHKVRHQAMIALSDYWFLEHNSRELRRNTRFSLSNALRRGLKDPPTQRKILDKMIEDQEKMGDQGPATMRPPRDGKFGLARRSS